MGKHVIILGAGASYSSGYPLAADLRVILSSVAALEEYLHSKVPINQATSRAIESFRNWFGKQSKSIQLFREGCFGTIDEFSFLARARYPEEVHQIKQIVGVLLALHNPEERFKVRNGENTSGFETSDYYPFVQKLFAEGTEVRNDVSVLTYNYDPYLDYLLYRSYRRRKEAAGEKIGVSPTKLTSGFGDRDARKIIDGNGFCMLKLHGTSVLPPQLNSQETPWTAFLTYEEVYWNRERWFSPENGKLLSTNPSPAMYFPWELLGDQGEFVSPDTFAGLDNLASGNAYFESTGRTLHQLCEAIWLRAKREIAEAEKISFVGLSMHKFLEPGLRYLFSERTAKRSPPNEDTRDTSLEIVLACPSAVYPGADFKRASVPNSAADRLASTLCRVYPKLMNSSGRLIAPHRGKAGSGGIVCYSDFKSFIQGEM